MVAIIARGVSGASRPRRRQTEDSDINNSHASPSQCLTIEHLVVLGISLLLRI